MSELTSRANVLGWIVSGIFCLFGVFAMNLVVLVLAVLGVVLMNPKIRMYWFKRTGRVTPQWLRGILSVVLTLLIFIGNSVSSIEKRKASSTDTKQEKAAEIYPYQQLEEIYEEDLETREEVTEISEEASEVKKREAAEPKVYVGQTSGEVEAMGLDGSKLLLARPGNSALGSLTLGDLLDHLRLVKEKIYPEKYEWEISEGGWLDPEGTYIITVKTVDKIGDRPKPVPITLTIIFIGHGEAAYYITEVGVNDATDSTLANKILVLSLLGLNNERFRK